MCQSENLWMKYSSIILPIRWGLTFIGICCCLQFLAFSFIGIARGYSMQTNWPFTVFLFGAPLLFIGIPLWKPLFFLALVVPTYLVILFSIFMVRTGHIEAGDEYYKNGQYQAAMKEFENASESKRWYLRMYSFVNSFESAVLLQIGRTSCQLADFDKASDTYKLIINRYPSSRDSTRAQKYLQDLEDGLKKVAKYDSQIPETKDNLNNLYDIARIYKQELNCDSKALDIYKKILEMDIDEKDKTRARILIEELW